MSNARNLANLLGTATTVQTAKIADDAITNAKLNDSGSFTVAGLTVSGTSTFQGETTATSTTAGFGAFDKILLNGTDGSSTDAGDSLLLNQTAAAGTDDGDEILFETATADVNEILNSNDTGVAGNINFTGTVKSGGQVLLLNATIGTVATYDISSTYINSAYDKYRLYYHIRPATDNVGIQIRFFVHNSIVDGGSTYSYESSSLNGNGHSNEGADKILINYDGAGNGSGEGNSGFIEFQNMNYSTFPACLTGLANNYRDGTHSLEYFSGAFIRGSKANAINGIRFYTSSGNITEGKIYLYGVVD